MENLNETKQIGNSEDLRRIFHFNVFNKIVWGNPLSQKDREIFVEWKKECSPNLNLFNFYSNKKILFEIVKYLGNSELCLNENIRWLYCSKIEYLLKIIYFYKLLEHRGENSKGDKIEGLTFYRGLANFTKREAPPFAIQEKKIWQEKWKEEYIKKIKSYSFGLDIDGKNIEDAYKEAKKVFNLFNKFKIKFSIWSSGKKGWHIIVPYEEFSEIVEPFDLDYTIAFCKSLMLDLVKHLKLKKVDTMIYSSSRYLKVPYSIDSRNGKVILPLDNSQFLTFLENKEKFFSQEYCLSLKDLGNRGAYCRRESNKEGFKNMISFLEEKIK